MKKSYKILINLMVYVIAVVSVINAIINQVTIPVYAVAAFIVGAFIIGMVIESGMTIRVKYFVDGLEEIKKISVGDWIDLRAAERVELKKGEAYNIPLGVGMILPSGYEALVLPRSSTPNRFGIICANSMGVIDNSYCGDADQWRFPAVALRDTVIEKGDRIAQFRIMENQPRLTFETVSHLKTRSRGGIGSTGKR